VGGGGGRGGGSSLNDDDDGADEDEATIDIDIDDDKREDFTTRSLSVCQDDVTVMMGKSPPLLAHRPPPCRGLPLQRDDGTAGVKNAAAFTTTAGAVGYDVT